MSFENPGDDEVRGLLSRVKRIAVVGLSPKAHRDSYRVSAYMQRQGYEIVPVYPREDEILGARERGRFVVMDRCLMVEHNRLSR